LSQGIAIVLVGVVDKTAPVLMIFLSFLVYTLFERKPLYPSVAFVAISLLGRLQQPLNDIVDSIRDLGDATISIDRVDEFLKGPEIEKSKQLSQNKLDGDRNKTIGFINASFTWDGESAFRLVNLDIKFAIGKLTDSGCMS
jgi:ABC-type multidrug transport system fused ATPase/permease subunit